MWPRNDWRWGEFARNQPSSLRVSYGKCSLVESVIRMGLSSCLEAQICNVS